jgi:hypothetical protein
MSAPDQAEYDRLDFKEVPAADYEEAKRLYEEVTRRSPPASDA